MQSKRIFVESRGGLGNQLFSYFFSLSVAKDYGWDTEIVTMDSHHSNSNLNSVKLASKNLKPPKVSNSRLKRIYIRICLKLKRLSSRTRNNLISRDAGLVDPKPLVERYFPYKVISGYFADFFYYDGIGLTGSDLEVLNPSREFLEYESIYKEKLFVALHVRYGDFVSDENEHGILDYEYYKRSIALVDEFLLSKLEIVVFCDQPELLEDLFIRDSRVTIFDSADLSAFEVMKIMGLARAMILCLSTFGFWAAKFNVMNPLVVYPSRNMIGELYIKSLPKSWLAQEPIFIN